MTSGSRRATSCEKAGQSLFIRRSRLLAFHVRNLRGSSAGLPSPSPPVAAPAEAGPPSGSAAAACRFLDGEPSLATGWKKRFIACGLRVQAAAAAAAGYEEKPNGEHCKIGISSGFRTHRLRGARARGGRVAGGVPAAVSWGRRNRRFVYFFGTAGSQRFFFPLPGPCLVSKNFAKLFRFSVTSNL